MLRLLSRVFTIASLLCIVLAACKPGGVTEQATAVSPATILPTIPVTSPTAVASASPATRSPTAVPDLPGPAATHAVTSTFSRLPYQPPYGDVRDPEISRYLSSPLPQFRPPSTACEPPIKNSSSIASFISSSVGWLLCAYDYIPPPTGQYRRLYKTADGGAHWELMSESPMRDQVGGASGSLPSIGMLGQMYFLDDTHGWLSVNYHPKNGPPDQMESPLVATDDGGRTWRSVFVTHGSYAITSVVFQSPMEGSLAVLDPLTGREVALTTRDGGATWAQPYPAAAPNAAWHFFDTQHGVGVGSIRDPGAVFTTEDGGATWRQIGSVNIGYAYKASAVSFPDPLHGWVLNEGATLHRATDGGTTWSDLPLQDIYAAVFVDARTGYMTNSKQQVLVTHDGGESIAQVIPVGPSPSGIETVRALTAKPMLAYKLFVNDPDTRRPSTNGWIDAPLLNGMETFQNYEGGLERDCDRLQKHPTGKQCQVILFIAVDGGEWTRYDLGAVVPLRVEFDRGVMRWMGQPAGPLYRTDDGGQTWTQVR